MRSLRAASLILLATVGAADAECRFKTPNSIMCMSGTAAATAYQEFGFDVELTNQSYNRALLQRSGCGRPYGDAWNKVKIIEEQHGRIPTRAGWIDVTLIDVDPGGKGWVDAGYIATDYLDGTCEVYVPGTTPSRH